MSKTVDQMTRTELRAECKRVGISYTGNDSKSDLLAKVLDRADADRNQAAADADASRCVPTGETVADGRHLLACGFPVNPAGFCCEHGTEVGSVRPEQVDAAVVEPLSKRERGDRMNLALAESKQVSEWKRGGKVGPRPETPATDAIAAAEREAAETPKSSKRSTTPAAPRVTKDPMTFTRNGVPMPPSANKFSCLAYQCTRDLDPTSPARVSARLLRTILLGKPYEIVDPMSGTWEVTLSNGVTIGAYPTAAAQEGAANVA